MESTNSNLSPVNPPRIINNVKPASVNQPPLLRKMFLLTEPAFKKYKEEIGDERYISNLDKEMKNVLRSKTPKYKKWIQYSRLLHRYLDFKSFLNESKTANDDIAIDRFKRLADRINQRSSAQPAPLSTSNVEEKKLKPTTPEQKSSIAIDTDAFLPEIEHLFSTETDQHDETLPEFQHSLSSEVDKSIQPHSNRSYDDTDMHISDSTPNENIFETSSPNESTILEAENSPSKFFSMLDTSIIPNETLNASHATNKMLSASVAAARLKSPNKSTARSRTKEVDSSIDNSAELEKHFDDHIIAKQTLRQRLDALPPNVQAKFLIDGKYPASSFRIEYINPLDKKETTIFVNGLDASIIRGGILREYIPSKGYSRHKVGKDGLMALRNFLVQFHNDIDDALHEYTNSNPTNFIKTKSYSLSDYGPNRDISAIRYKKNTFIKVPKTILDSVTNALDEYDLTAKELKTLVKTLKKEYKKNHVENLNRTTFGLPTASTTTHPLNRSYTFPSSSPSLLSADSNYSKRRLPASPAPTVSSTPKAKKKKASLAISIQKPMTSFYRQRKATSTQSEDRPSVEIDWEKI